MEARMKKYRQVSPERSKVWTERSPKYHQVIKKVPVVYYLCRNRLLEHPHFMEVSLSSPDGLRLKDVIERLNVLRGRGMPSMYSWSCKRSYKSGFVWHDLSEDDLILPTHGNEYVLKGSELFEESISDRFSPVSNIKIQNLKQLPGPLSTRSQDDSSSSYSMNVKGSKQSNEEELSPPVEHLGSSSMSPESRDEKICSWGGPGHLSLTEYKVYKSDGLADASTQTEENVSRSNTRVTCTRGVSTDEPECNENYQTQHPCTKNTSEMCRDSISPAPSSSSASSSGGKTTETLESLIRADASKINSFRILEEEDIRMQPNARLKATNMLMQLISCGSISVKDNSFGIVPTYRPRFMHSKFPSPFFSSSVLLGELDCLSENPRLMSLRLEDKEYFSGSLIETRTVKEANGNISLKRSSSYNADRACNQTESVEEEKDDSNSLGSKCIPLSIKSSLTKEPRSESMRSPVSDKPRNSSDRVDNSQTNASTSNSSCSSKRISNSVASKTQSTRLDSFREETERVIQIEERLASGARVIIQSKAPCDAVG